LPLKLTTESPPKLLPLTVSMKAGLPTGVLFGLRELIIGGGLIVKLAELEVTPPELTVTPTVPAVVIKPAGILTINWLVVTEVGVSVLPLKLTVEPPPKPLPLTVRVNAAPPAVALVGLMELIIGGGLTVKLAELEVTPPELTVTATVADVEIKFAGMVTISWPAVMELGVSALPLKLTIESAPNPLPFTIRVNAGPPAVALVGLIELIIGGGLIVNVTEFEVAPPELIVTGTMPGVTSRLAGTAAVTWVVLPGDTVVVKAVPLKLTDESEPNPAPFTVKVNPGAPAVANIGLMLVMLGAIVPE
jgi:xanthosine utilization system XapX-like protein